MDLSGEVSVLSVRRDESHDTNLATERKKFGNFWNSSDVFGTVICGKPEVFVESCPDYISVKDENFLGVFNHLIDVFFDEWAECALTSSWEPRKPKGTSWAKFVASLITFIHKYN